MKLVLKDAQSTLTVSDAIFGRDFNEALVHQVAVSYAAIRQKTRSQKTRAEVAGSNKKPWRQKGTGRARAGSVKSPIWRSGGITFAAKPHNYCHKVNKKMYREALKSILSELVRQDRLIIVQEFCIKAPKTRLLVEKLENITFQNVLIIIGELDVNLFLASRNIYKVNVRDVHGIDPISLIASEKVIMTTDSIQKIERMLV